MTKDAIKQAIEANIPYAIEAAKECLSEPYVMKNKAIEWLDKALESINIYNENNGWLPIDIESLHSKIDMDIEDELGRDVTLAESKCIGLAVKFTAAALQGGER